ncbi:hypothetical protein ACXWPL_09860, partial [Streptococcus pyogenes]
EKLWEVSGSSENNNAHSGDGDTPSSGAAAINCTDNDAEMLLNPSIGDFGGGEEDDDALSTMAAPNVAEWVANSLIPGAAS